MGRLRVVTWNGKDLPHALRDLPAGHYVVQPVEVVPDPDDGELNLTEVDIEEIEVGEALYPGEPRTNLG